MARPQGAPYAGHMATIVFKSSDATSYLLEAGKLVKLDALPHGARRDALVVDDGKFGDLITAFGAPLGGQPIANFTHAATGTPHEVAFTDTSTNGATDWSWTFGDGDAAATQNPTHLFDGPGDYTVTLIASNAGGDSLPHAVVVTVT